MRLVCAVLKRFASEVLVQAAHVSCNDNNANVMWLEQSTSQQSCQNPPLSPNPGDAKLT